MKIWCVEDDESIRDMEVYTLNSTDFEATGFQMRRLFVMRFPRISRI